MNDVETRLNRALHAQADAFDEASAGYDTLGQARPLISAGRVRNGRITAAISGLATAAAIVAVTVAVGHDTSRRSTGEPVQAGATTAQIAPKPGTSGTRTSVLRLTAGSGIVTWHHRPLGGATVTVKAGRFTVSAVTRPDGTFTLPKLPTPASISVMTTEHGWTSQQLWVTLPNGQRGADITVTLAAASGG